MRSQLIAWDNLSWNLCSPNFVLDNYLWLKIIDKNINIEIKFKRENNLFIVDFRRTVVTKAPLRVQFLPTFGGVGGEEQEASALLRKKGRGRGLRESAKV